MNVRHLISLIIILYICILRNIVYEYIKQLAERQQCEFSWLRSVLRVAL